SEMCIRDRLEDLSAAYAICKRFGGSPRPRVVCSCEKEPDSQPDRGWALFGGFASIAARRLGAGPSFCGCLPQTGAPPLLVETAQRWLGASQEEGDPLRRIVDAVVGPSRHGLALAAPGSATHANSTADAIAIAYGLEDEEASDLRALLARRPPASASV
ncbi:MAG: hypothetical protein QUU85_18060, partial [Candidatus Eisenbacteria bacterium]|nr:hypothetical protein [Candidatus Eisenbacteria bacterium]